MSNDHQCFEELKNKWDGQQPFERPIMIDPKTLDMAVGGWTIRLYRLTKAGNISKKGTGHLQIEYCPLCGEKLVPAEDAPESS